MTDIDNQPTILVVDDEPAICSLVSEFLTNSFMKVFEASNAAQARELMEQEKIDLVVLDVMMPGEDGLSLCRHISSTSRTPVLLLTALSDDADRIVGLETGADDYLPKPFNPRELLARIRAILRRANYANETIVEKTESDTIKFGYWTLEMGPRELIKDDGTVLSLSTGEFQMLNALLSRPGTVYTRDQLLDMTKGRESDPFDRSVDNQISRLRRKIELDPKDPRFIQTVWGGGYRFMATVEKT